MKKQGDTTFQILLTALEGNNHLAALIHAAFGSFFDSKEGTIQHGSITSDWLVCNLSAKVANDKDDLKLRLLGIDFKKLIKAKLSDESSMFNQVVNFIVHFGLDSVKFEQTKVPFSKIRDAEIQQSRTYCHHKIQSIVPPEMYEVSEKLGMILDLIESNDKPNDGHYPSFSANASNNGDLYVESEPLSKTSSKAGKTIKSCKIFKTEKAMRFRENPSCEIF